MSENLTNSASESQNQSTEIAAKASDQAPISAYCQKLEEIIN